jgi:hypothetical protein
MKLRASVAFAVIGTAAAVRTVTHTRTFTSVQQATARFGKTTEGAQDKDLNMSRPALPPDSGLAGCTVLAGTHPVAAADYPAIGARFAGSRWPDLRFSALAYIEIAARLLTTNAYGGETAWFCQRLSAACAKHGPPAAFLIRAGRLTRTATPDWFAARRTRASRKRRSS